MLLGLWRCGLVWGEGLCRWLAGRLSWLGAGWLVAPVYTRAWENAAYPNVHNRTPVPTLWSSQARRSASSRAAARSRLLRIDSSAARSFATAVADSSSSASRCLISSNAISSDPATAAAASAGGAALPPLLPEPPAPPPRPLPGRAAPPRDAAGGRRPAWACWNSERTNGCEMPPSPPASYPLPPAAPPRACAGGCGRGAAGPAAPLSWGCCCCCWGSNENPASTHSLSSPKSSSPEPSSAPPASATRGAPPARSRHSSPSLRGAAAAGAGARPAPSDRMCFSSARNSSSSMAWFGKGSCSAVQRDAPPGLHDSRDQGGKDGAPKPHDAAAQRPPPRAPHLLSLPRLPVRPWSQRRSRRLRRCTARGRPLPIEPGGPKQVIIDASARGRRPCVLLRGRMRPRSVAAAWPTPGAAALAAAAAARASSPPCVAPCVVVAAASSRATAAAARWAGCVGVCLLAGVRAAPVVARRALRRRLVAPTAQGLLLALRFTLAAVVTTPAPRLWRHEQRLAALVGSQAARDALAAPEERLPGPRRAPALIGVVAILRRLRRAPRIHTRGRGPSRAKKAGAGVRSPEKQQRGVSPSL
jgi:hypothetical protein